MSIDIGGNTALLNNPSDDPYFDKLVLIGWIVQHASISPDINWHRRISGTRSRVPEIGWFQLGHRRILDRRIRWMRMMVRMRMMMRMGMGMMRRMFEPLAASLKPKIPEPLSKASHWGFKPLGV